MAIMVGGGIRIGGQEPAEGECGTLARRHVGRNPVPSGAAAGTRSRDLRRRRHDRGERGSPRDASRRFARSVGADRAVSVLGHESLLQIQPAERCVSGHAEGERDGASRTGPQDVHRRVDLGAARPGRKPDRRWSAGHCTRCAARGRADPGSAVDDGKRCSPRRDRAGRAQPRGGTCSCFTGHASRPEPVRGRHRRISQSGDTRREVLLRLSERGILQRLVPVLLLGVRRRSRVAGAAGAGPRHASVQLQ